jgi:hypothetical protein
MMNSAQLSPRRACCRLEREQHALRLISRSATLVCYLLEATTLQACSRWERQVQQLDNGIWTRPVNVCVDRIAP